MQGVTAVEKQPVCPGNPHWNTRFKRYAFADTLSDDLRELFRDAEGLLQKSELVKNSRSTTAGIFDVNGTEYFIKRSNVNSLGERVRRIGRLARSSRNKLAAEKLAELKILTPRVYMALETGHALLPGASYLITEALPRPVSVAENLAEVLEFFGSAEKLALAICSMVIKVHCSSMSHGDLKMANILACKASDGSYRLGLFDLDGVQWHGSNCSEYAVVKDLARMASSYCFYAHRRGILEEREFAGTLRMWGKAYAAAGGKDYTSNRFYWQRIGKFLPNYNIQELQQ